MNQLALLLVCKDDRTVNVRFNFSHMLRIKLHIKQQCVSSPLSFEEENRGKFHLSYKASDIIWCVSFIFKLFHYNSKVLKWIPKATLPYGYWHDRLQLWLCWSMSGTCSGYELGVTKIANAYTLSNLMILKIRDLIKSFVSFRLNIYTGRLIFCGICGVMTFAAHWKDQNIMRRYWSLGSPAHVTFNDIYSNEHSIFTFHPVTCWLYHT